MATRRDVLKGLGSLAGAPPPGDAAAAVLAARTTSSAIAALPLGVFSVVGTRYHEAASRLSLAAGEALLLRREPAHRRDPHAIAVHAASGERLGYLPREDARRLAPLIDAGGRVEAEVLADSLPSAAGDGARLDARLRLLADATPPAHGQAASQQVAHLLQAPPLLAESTAAGARAVMLSGPCAGWQRTAAVEWVPPGALPLPAWEVLAHQYRLSGGEAAAVETARAMREAERLGLPRPGTEDDPPPPRHLATPAERPKLLLRGRLLLDGRREDDQALAHLALRRPAGGAACLICDSAGTALGALPASAGQMVARLEEEGFHLSVWPAEAGLRSRVDGRLSLVYEICLRGDDPPPIARARAETLLHIARILPANWDAEQQFGRLPYGVMNRFLTPASPVAHRQGGRLDAVQAEAMLAAARQGHALSCDADEDPRAPSRRLVRRGDMPADPLAPKRRGRGLPLPQRLRLVAARLDGGLRETPQRFLPVAQHVWRLGMRERRYVMGSLIRVVREEAMRDARCPDSILAMLADAEAGCHAGGGQRWLAMLHRLGGMESGGEAAPGRRHRRFNFLACVADCGLAIDAIPFSTLAWVIAYAMADYDTGPYILEGQASARRVRWLADLIEAGMADRAGLHIEALGPG